ncbi:hypothetical protein MRX96_000930 [Rhipicephalus microplus]
MRRCLHACNNSLWAMLSRNAAAERVGALSSSADSADDTSVLLLLTSKAFHDVTASSSHVVQHTGFKHNLHCLLDTADVDVVEPLESCLQNTKGVSMKTRCFVCA